ncbi:MAG: hypothetical protein GY913_06030 [Proteobacteria bacterium]|nr:hypothetical protein [Pseudomonadota bacterium]MCP4916464.1 hypothetical protein [Pseudomonadota bacterium]
MTELQKNLRLLLADRHGPETRAFYGQLLGYIDRRARLTWRSCYRDLISEAEVEEAVAEVLKLLMCGALTRFRGESLGELFGFVRTITDRCIWRLAQKNLRERRVLEGDGAEAAEGWFGTVRGPSELVDHVPDVPLSEADQAFLIALVGAESKVEYSRQNGVSRAAVTQRVQRIRKRIAQLEPRDRGAVDVWLHMQARAHIAATPKGS